MGEGKFEGFSSTFLEKTAKLSDDHRNRLSDWIDVRPVQIGATKSSPSDSLVGMTFAIGATLRRAAPDNLALVDAVEELLSLVAKEAEERQLIPDSPRPQSDFPDFPGRFILLPPDQDPPQPKPGSGTGFEDFIIIPPDQPSNQGETCVLCGQPLGR